MKHIGEISNKIVNELTKQQIINIEAIENFYNDDRFIDKGDGWYLADDKDIFLGVDPEEAIIEQFGSIEEYVKDITN